MFHSQIQRGSHDFVVVAGPAGSRHVCAAAGFDRARLKPWDAKASRRFPQASDLTVVSRLNAVFIRVSAADVLPRPAV